MGEKKKKKKKKAKRQKGKYNEVKLLMVAHSDGSVPSSVFQSSELWAIKRALFSNFKVLVERIESSQCL